MPRLWCSISSHGFGHAAQVIPVLNELGQRIPGLEITLRTEVPEWFFRNRLTADWTYSRAQQDIGCVQRGPLSIEVDATWEAHLRFHQRWRDRVLREAEAIKAAHPSLVLSDVSYLATEAGAKAGIPTVALCNLSWDLVLEALLQPNRSEQLDAIRHIEQAYSWADLMIQPTPGIPLKAFRRVTGTGPIADSAVPERAKLLKAIAAAPEERVALIGFGGISLDSLPFQHLEQMLPYRFIVGGPVPSWCQRTRPLESTGLSFRTLLASADLVVTKPGYSTIVEAAALKKPVVYVRRYNFADEEVLVTYLHRYGRGAELTKEDFASGRWFTALDRVWAATGQRETPPPPSGATEAATVLTQFL